MLTASSQENTSNIVKTREHSLNRRMYIYACIMATILICMSCTIGPEFNVWVFSDDCLCEYVPPEYNPCEDVPLEGVLLENCPSDSCNCETDGPTELCQHDEQQMSAIDKVSNLVNRDLTELDEEDWIVVTGTIDITDGQYKVYECSWRNIPDEWVIYRRRNNRSYIFRFFK